MKGLVTGIWGMTQARDGRACRRSRRYTAARRRVVVQALGNGIVATVAGIDVLSDARSDVFFGCARGGVRSPCGGTREYMHIPIRRYAGAMTAAAVAFMAMGRGFAYVDTAAASTDLIVGNTPGADGIDIDSDKL